MRAEIWTFDRCAAMVDEEPSRFFCSRLVDERLAPSKPIHLCDQCLDGLKSWYRRREGVPALG